MRQLSDTQLHYLTVIYDLAQTMPGIGVSDIARVRGVSKATATQMVGVLVDAGLVFRESYGKIYLTEAGFQKAKRLRQKTELLSTLIPKMGLKLDGKELQSAAYTLAVSLPEQALDALEGQSS
jgi:Mn-dependent DtxR family transcriptional regulator